MATKRELYEKAIDAMVDLQDGKLGSYEIDQMLQYLNNKNNDKKEVVKS